MVAAAPAAGVWITSAVRPGTWILCGTFAIVSSILLWLLVISRGWMEKVYFAFCAVSATSGLLRTAAGDQAFHAGLYIRVVSAVLVGLLIVRMHARSDSEYAESAS
jgi:cytochrome b561